MRNGTMLITAAALIAGCASEAAPTDPGVGVGESAYVIWQNSPDCLIRKSLAPSIKMCVSGHGDLAKAQQLTRDSLLKWLAAIRPLDARVTSTIVFDCTAPDGTVSVANSGEFAYPGNVSVDDGSAPGTYLHEFGHAFACLGDTYVGGTAGACMAGQPHSVMCDGLLVDQLEPDDVTGAQIQFRTLVEATPFGGSAGASLPGGDAGATATADAGATTHAGDADGDGVADADDLCPGTPAGANVWHDEYAGRWKGCATGQVPTRAPGAHAGDGDGDGVSDDQDRCPTTPPGRAVWHDEYAGRWKGCASGEVPVR